MMIVLMCVASFAVGYIAVRVAVGDPPSESDWEFRDRNWEYIARDGKYEPSVEEMYAEGGGDA